MEDRPIYYESYVRLLEAKIGRLRAANERLGRWMSAALDDPRVCAEMKADIHNWFAAWEKE